MEDFQRYSVELFVNFRESFAIIHSFVQTVDVHREIVLYVYVYICIYIYMLYLAFSVNSKFSMVL